MSTSFSLADQSVLDLLADVMRERHRPLYDAGVLVGVIMAASDTGDAVVHGGYKVLATVRAISLKDRVYKPIDAEVLIDLQAYDELSYRQKMALLDHELSHLELKKWGYAPVRDAAGELTGEEEIRFEKDDLGRPTLRLKNGDFHCGDGFDSVIRHWGDDAAELANIMAAHARATRARRDGEQEEYRHVG